MFTIYLKEILLIHLTPIFYMCTPWKHQKTRSFLTFSRGKEMENWQNRHEPPHLLRPTLSIEE